MTLSRKLLYVVVDGMADRPLDELGGLTPLEYADTPSMDRLAKLGLTGLMYTVERGIAPESDVAVLSILGYDPHLYHTGRGVLEAVGAGLEFKDGYLALRCNFATVGGDWELIDRRVGRSLSTEEAAELGKAINEEVKLESHPADFEFKTTIGHRAVLVIKGRGIKLSSKITNTDPAYVKVEGMGVAASKPERRVKRCEPLVDEPEAKASADLVNEFTEKSRRVLEKHPINVRREAEGKLKANVVLARDAGDRLPGLFSLEERYGVKFSCLADMPVEKGIAKLAGMEVVELPPSTGRFKEDYELRVEEALKALEGHDAVYVHLKGPDEPGHDGDARRKAAAIEAVDKLFLTPLLERVSLEEALICVTSDHATPCSLRGHSDDPVPILIAGGDVKPDSVEKFSERECAKGGLGVLERGVELMPKLISMLRGA